ncbi:MAG: FAD-dependent oxidoreductase [Clostridia bacterium]|nr:FAD-dependent oxidoreductase [Clostridia bacterium]
MQKIFSVSPAKEYDVIVVGGGVAGCAAAIRAARDGADVLLIEASGSLGGMASGGMVPEFCPYTDGEKIIHHGIAEEMLFKMKAVTPDEKERLDYCTIDAEWMKYFLDGSVSEAGVDVLFFSTLCAVEGEGGRILGVTVANKSGLSHYTAGAFVDATGDADLCALSGCEFEVGDENGNMQMPTLCFTLSGVRDEGKPIEAMVREQLPNIILDPLFPRIDNDFFCSMKLADGVWGCNAGHVRGINPLDRMSVSAGMIEGRKKAREYLFALKKYLPSEFSSAHIVATAPLLGIRETRRIRGEYTITVEDYQARRSFPDEIGRNGYAIDLHDAVHFYGGENANAKYGKYKNGESHGIPLRALIPRATKNLFVGGRSISCERAVQSSLRIIPVCFVTGEAAGAAAAVSALKGKMSTDVCISDINR